MEKSCPSCPSCPTSRLSVRSSSLPECIVIMQSCSLSAFPRSSSADGKPKNRIRSIEAVFPITKLMYSRGPYTEKKDCFAITGKKRK